MSAPVDEELLDELRPVAFAIAYRMLGSVAEAEDVVQEALLRLHRSLESGERIESPRAFLATVTTRLAIDELRSARSRRERYVGDWLPEPIVTGGLRGLSAAPEQRAVFLLRDVFDYGYDEIASIVGRSQPAVRQLAVRARAHLDWHSRPTRPRFRTSRAQRDELSRRFFAAVQEGDVAGLEALLAHDVVLTGDGGGKVPALARRLRGRSRVARTLFNWVRWGSRVPGSSLRPVEVNGAPGALLLDGEGRLVAVWALEVSGGQITGVSSIINPDKLGHLGPVADVRALLEIAVRASR